MGYENTTGCTHNPEVVAIFDLGEKALEPLKQAGAKQISPHGTISNRRLDMVYSLLDGLKPNPPRALAGYKENEFGIQVGAGCTLDDVTKMGERHGFEVKGRFTPQGIPNCYVKFKAGKALAELLKAVLTGEPKVVSVYLNYFDL